MNISGLVPLAAPQTAVWQLLTTPEQLCGCLPGLQTWQPLSDCRFQLEVVWQFAPNGHKPILISIEWTDWHPPVRLDTTAVLTYNQQPIDVNGRFTLNAISTHQTELHFDLTIDSPNTFIDQLARKLAPRLIDNYFVCLKTRLFS